MKFLVDENVARSIVNWVRATGHDVLYASDTPAGTPDTSWAVLSTKTERLILTFDKDFGEIVFRDGLTVHGLILLRLDDDSVEQMLTRLQEAWSVIEANPVGRIIVITENKIRVRPLPRDDS